MSLTFDFRDLRRVERDLAAYADQIPFALAQALNDGAEAARREIIEQTWPAHMQVRNARFMAAAMTTRGERATKARLRVVLYDRLGRGSLVLHEQGGTKRPRGAALAVPDRKNLQPRRSGAGVPKGLRPRNLDPAKTFKTIGKFGTEVIYQRTGGKKNPGLRLMYALRPSAPIKAEVPFHHDFERVMRREVPRAFGVRLKAAVASRRKS